MCDPASNVQATRSLKVAGAVIRQCLGCGSIGIEFGTSYLVFEPDDFFKFANWFAEEIPRRQRQDRGREKIYIQLSNPGLMLALSEAEVASLGSVLQAGRPWVAEGLKSPLGAGELRPTTLATLHSDSTVH